MVLDRKQFEDLDDFGDFDEKLERRSREKGLETRKAFGLPIEEGLESERELYSHEQESSCCGH